MNSKIVLFLFCSFTAFFLTSCSLFYVTNADTDLDSQTDVMEDVESTDDTALPDKFFNIDGVNGIVLSDGLKYHEFNDGNAVVVYNDKNAWVFDLMLNKVIPLVDYDAMYSAADPTGRGRKYFDGDLTLDLDFPHESESQIRIHFHVYGDDGCEYSVYNHYSVNDGNASFSPGGDVGKYYFISLVYPGHDEPLISYDINDYERLALSDETANEHYVYKLARAIIENDVKALTELCHLENPNTLSSWEGMEISEYSISRKFPFTYLDELELYLKIEKSNIKTIPPGEYSVKIAEGLGVNIEFENLNSAETAVNTEAVIWATPWISTYGGMDVSKMVVTNQQYLHALLDSTTWYYDSEEPLTLESFSDYCEDTFCVFGVKNYCTEEFITNHGGHGLPSELYKIREELTASGVSQIIVDYYADPMYSVIARTYKFTVSGVDSGNFGFDNVQVIYDSGLRVYGWTA